MYNLRKVLVLLTLCLLNTYHIVEATSIHTRHKQEDYFGIVQARILKATYKDKTSGDMVSIDGEQLVKLFPVLLNLTYGACSIEDIMENIAVIKMLPMSEIRLWICPITRYDKTNNNNNMMIASQIVAYFYKNAQISRYLEYYSENYANHMLVRFHPNGKLFSFVNFESGTPDITDSAIQSFQKTGHEVIFNEEGNLLLEQSFESGLLHGDSIFWFDNEQKKLHLHYSKGVLQGEIQGWFQNGHIAFKEMYIDNKIESGSYFFPNGEAASSIENGVGTRTIFAIHSIPTINNGDQDAFCIEPIDCGQPNGNVYIKSFKSGHINISYYIKNGKKQGAEIIYYPNSTQPKLSIPWKDHSISGTKITWYRNGLIESTSQLINGQRIGATNVWYNNKEHDIMLAEYYDKNHLLISGKYYAIGNGNNPIAEVINGCGSAYIFFEDGVLKHISSYLDGKAIS